MRGLNFFVSVLFLCCAPGLLRAEEVTEPATGHAFTTPLEYGGKTYQLIGTGVRKKLFIKVYAMGLYLEEAARQSFPSLVAKAGGADRAKILAGERAQSFVSWGRFGKLAVMHFVRDVDKDKIQGAYRESLESSLSDKAQPDLKRDAEAFIALFDHDVQEGQELRILTDDAGRITVEVAGQKKAGPQNPQLCRAIWDIWLGSKPISKDMRKSLVERIDVFAK
jgi:hypothetical protein